MNEHNADYAVFRTKKRIAVIRRIVAITLLVATGYYFITTGLPSPTGRVSWVIDLVLFLLKCYLIARSAISVAVTVSIWASSLRLLGFAALRGAPTMLRLGRLSANRQGWRNSLVYVALTLALILFWQTLDIEIMFFFAIYAASRAFSDFVGSARTVGVLFLSRSSRLNLSFQIELKEAALGLRVVSLLDQEQEPDRKVTRVLTWNVYRTSNSAEWRGVIKELMDLAQIIVLDMRECSPALRMETGLALTPLRRHKVLALTAQDGSAPVLDDFIRHSDDPHVYELHRLTETQLLAEVHRRIRSRLYPASMQGRHLPIQGESVRRDQSAIAPRGPSRVFVPSLQRSYEVPAAAFDPYTPAEMNLAIGMLDSVAVHCDYPDKVEKLDEISRLIHDLLLRSGIRWVATAGEAEATIWIQEGTGETSYIFVVASPSEFDKYISGECGSNELAFCIVTAIIEFFHPQDAGASEGDRKGLMTTIQHLNRALTRAVFAQDMEKVRHLMLELKVAVERIGSAGGTQAFRVVAAAIADSAAAYENTGFAEAHALLEAAIEAAHNIGPAIIPMLEKGLKDPDPAVRRAFQSALRQFGKTS